MKRHACPKRTCPNRPPISHAWSYTITRLREEKKAKEEILTKIEKTEDLFGLIQTICMTRTSSGKVGVEYPALRKMLKYMETKWSTLGDTGWRAIRRHVTTNSTRLDERYETYLR